MAAAADPPTIEAPSPQDCGLNALSLLLRVEGRPADLATLERALPPVSSRGYSMAELAEAARAHGLRLEGIDLGAGELPRNRSVIAFAESGGTGHFVVLRPVGVTGTMVQVLDPPTPPRVVDVSSMRGDPAWTGRLLVPRTRIERLDHTLAVAAGAVGLVLLSMSACRGCLAIRNPRRFAAPRPSDKCPTPTTMPGQSV